MLTRYDKALIYFLLLFAILSFTVSIYVAQSAERASEVVVSADGRETTYSLQDKRRIKAKGPLGECEIEISPGKVRMLSSPCPRKVCIAQGWIDETGEVIVCAPNRVVVKITGEQRNDSLDAISK